MSLRRTSTRAAALLASAALTASLAACGGDPEPTAAEPTESSSPTDEATSSPSETATPEPEESASDEAPDADVAAFLDRLKAGFGEEGSVHVSMRMTGPQSIQAEGDTAYGPD